MVHIESHLVLQESPWPGAERLPTDTWPRKTRHSSRSFISSFHFRHIETSSPNVAGHWLDIQSGQELAQDSLRQHESFIGCVKHLVASIASLADRVKRPADVGDLKGAGDRVAFLGDEVDLAGSMVLD